MRAHAASKSLVYYPETKVASLKAIPEICADPFGTTSSGPVTVRVASFTHCEHPVNTSIDQRHVIQKQYLVDVGLRACRIADDFLDDHRDLRKNVHLLD
jgi:3'-phosphoadenosine 5'-phosphosulfate (PAPS) 3'-phosphatase